MNPWTLSKKLTQFVKRKQFMDINDIKKIKAEIKSFNDIVSFAENRIISIEKERIEFNKRKAGYPFRTVNIDGTSESSALKSAIKILNFKLKKIIN